MSPIAEISLEKSREVLNWIGSKRQGLNIANGGVEGRVFIIATVDGEPLIIDHNPQFSGETKTLVCSDNHARELEQKGIVQFPKPQRRK